MNLAFVILIGLASLSPALTLLALWQVKEWRWDRLMDHLRSEGSLQQLFGTVRPIVAIVWLIVIVMFAAIQIRQLQEFGQDLSLPQVFNDIEPFLFLGYALTFAGLALLQLITNKQRKPVWTLKAQLMCTLSMVIAVSVTYWSSAFLHIMDYTPRVALALAMPFLMPLVIALSWLLLRPLDHFLKNRVLNRAKALRKAHPNLTVIGITGSVGKTTTKELLAHILKNKDAMATPLHVNTEMGVAAWMTKTLQREPEDSKKILIVEMGAYRKGEIKLLSDIAQPTLGIITFIGTQHISLFGGQEAIRQAKGELFVSLPATGHAFWNHDNNASAPLPKLCRCPVTSVGTDGKANLNAFDIEETGSGIRFSLEKTTFNVPLAGTHTVTSILLAIVSAKHLGMTLPEISHQLATFKPLAGTFEVKTVNGVTVLDDTYNTSPESFLAAIRWAAAQPHDNKILLTDGIIELGAEEEAIHRSLAEEAAPIFQKALIGNPRILSYFIQSAFGARTHIMQQEEKLKQGSLLVCIGRVKRSSIEKLLP